MAWYARPLLAITNVLSVLQIRTPYTSSYFTLCHAVAIIMTSSDPVATTSRYYQGNQHILCGCSQLATAPVTVTSVINYSTTLGLMLNNQAILPIANSAWAFQYGLSLLCFQESLCMRCDFFFPQCIQQNVRSSRNAVRPNWCLSKGHS